MKTNIRNIMPSDYETVSGMMSGLHNLHHDNRPDIYSSAEKPLKEYDFTQMVDTDNHISLIAEIDDKPAAICLVTLKQAQTPLFVSRKIAFMEALYVAEDYRRTGIGRELYSAVLERAREMGADSLELMVWSFNDEAVKFYEEMGMKAKSSFMEVKL